MKQYITENKLRTIKLILSSHYQAKTQHLHESARRSANAWIVKEIRENNRGLELLLIWNELKNKHMKITRMRRSNSHREKINYLEIMELC